LKLIAGCVAHIGPINDVAPITIGIGDGIQIGRRRRGVIDVNAIIAGGSTTVGIKQIVASITIVCRVRIQVRGPTGHIVYDAPPPPAGAPTDVNDVTPLQIATVGSIYVTKALDVDSLRRSIGHLGIVMTLPGAPMDGKIARAEGVGYEVSPITATEIRSVAIRIPVAVSTTVAVRCRAIIVPSRGCNNLSNIALNAPA
jgi:hypothetical protein